MAGRGIVQQVEPLPAYWDTAETRLYGHAADTRLVTLPGRVHRLSAAVGVTVRSPRVCVHCCLYCSKAQ
jgi:hypothetical protein